MARKVLFLSSVLIGGIIIGLSIAVRLDLFIPAQSQALNPQTSSSAGLNIEDAVINVAATTGKAVVSISTEQVSRIPGGRKFYFSTPHGSGQFPDDEIFHRFFGDFFGDIPEREFKQRGLGSGVIIDERGYILTNAHVIEGAEKITVTLPDGRDFKGEAKGMDTRSDLAVIKIDAHNLPVANLGNSDILKIGQWVVAIGNPFAFAMRNPEPTVTVGVISALHRSLSRIFGQNSDYNDVIQTDAAINPGNSGGPLVNIRGEVVGINVAIFSTSGGYQGIGFAIPINYARKIIPRLIEGKKVLYGWLGVTVQDLTTELADHLGVPDKNGALVANVMENGPAQKAGIKDADVITKIDSLPVNNVGELLNIVGSSEIGKPIKLTVIRDKKEVIIPVLVGERPENIEKTMSAPAVINEVKKWRGMKVEDLNPTNKQRFGLNAEKGVVVADVDQDSEADNAGIIPGDIIEEINKTGVNNISDYEKLTQSLKGGCLIRTNRGYFVVKE